jgi:hypothetical protein
LYEGPNLFLPLGSYSHYDFLVTRNIIATDSVQKLKDSILVLQVSILKVAPSSAFNSLLTLPVDQLLLVDQ